MKPINTLSTFNGMGCIWYALKRAGIPMGKCYSSEIDKHATKANDAAFPDTIQMGDVTKWREWDIDWSSIDLFVGGSPCQGFSFAGKQLNFNDPRSELFFIFSDILNHIKKLNPDVLFLLENVQMKKEYQKVINDTLGIFPSRINSNLISAQNRDRNYWTNIRTRQEGLFGELYTDIPQPKDEGILLKDILQPESEVDEKYYLKNHEILRGFEKHSGKEWKSGNRMGNMEFPNDENKKAKCLTTIQIPGDRAVNHVTGIDINGKAPTQRSSTGRCLDDKHNYQIIKIDKKGNKKPDQNKAGCLTAGGHSGGNHSDMDIICVAMRGRNIVDGKRKDYLGAPTEQRLEANAEDKTNCLTSVAKDNLILSKGYIQDNSNGHNSQANRYYFEDNKAPSLGSGNAMKCPQIIQKPRGFNKGGGHKEKSPTLTSNSWEQNNILQQDYKLRRLTPRECGYLQTFTKEEMDLLLASGISDTQLYKMFGNGWTIDVIAWILSFMK